MTIVLSYLQILSLFLIGLILVQITLWSFWTNNNVALTSSFSVILVYVGYISLLFLGDTNKWQLKLITIVWDKLFGSLQRVIPTFILLLIAAVFLGVNVYHLWHDPLRILFQINGDRLKETVTVNLQTVEGSTIYSTDNSELQLSLSPAVVKSDIVLSASSKNYKTPEPIKLKSGLNIIQLKSKEFSLPVRWALVKDGSSLTFKKNNQDLQIFPDSRFTWFPHLGDGTAEQDPNYHSLIINWLKEQSRFRKKAKFLPYFNERTNLMELTFSRPEVVNTLRPTIAEYNKYGEVQKDIVNKWLTEYVGVWAPRIRFTVDNSKGGSKLQLISLIYDVKSIRVFKNDIPFPQTQEFNAELEYRTAYFPRILILTFRDYSPSRNVISQALLFSGGHAKSSQLRVAPLKGDNI